MKTIQHLELKIARALSWDDVMLADALGGDPVTIRKGLIEAKERGEVYINTMGCEGFDPVTGCPGHPSDTDSITKQ